MKKITFVSKLLGYGLVAKALFMAPALKAETESYQTTVLASTVQMPAGTSMATFLLSHPGVYPSLYVTYQPSPYCAGFSVQIETASSGSPLRPARLVAGFFEPLEQPVAVVKLVFYSAPRFQTCAINVVSRGRSPREPQTEKTFLGVVSHKGGFSSDSKFEFKEPVRLKKLEVFVPGYCRQLEVLRGKVEGPAAFTDENQEEILITNASEDPENEEDFHGQSRWVELTLPPSGLIKSLLLTLSSPPQETCDLALYGVLGQ